jgi:signal transduction histidine kinase
VNVIPFVSEGVPRGDPYDRGTHSASLQPLSLLAALRDVIELCAVRIKELSPNFYVLADSMRLHHILLSLLNNALACSPSGSTIEISARQEGR